MSIEDMVYVWRDESLWRKALLWWLWPLRWRGPLWFWIEEHTR